MPGRYSLGPTLQARAKTGRSASRYDPRRAQARLALIEQQLRLASAVNEREEILARQPASIDPGDPQEVARIKAERAICDAERWVKELIPQVGDPEAVVNEQGWLPSERRERLGEHSMPYLSTT